MSTIPSHPIPVHLAAYAHDGSWANMTIGDYARRWAEAEPDRVVFLNDPAKPTYASLLADGEALARALLDLGLQQGENGGFSSQIGLGGDDAR